MTKQDLFRFLERRFLLEGLRKASKDYYIGQLNSFLDFVEKEYKITSYLEITRDMLEEYILFQKEKGNKNTSINKIIRVTKKTNERLIEFNLMEKNFTEGVRELKEETPLITPLSIEEIEYILTSIDKSTFAGFRFYVTLVLLLDVGIRRKELLKLKWTDLDEENLTLTIRNTKNRHDRLAFISESTLKLLKQLRRKKPSKDDGYIFLSHYGKNTPMTISALSKQIANFNKTSAIRKINIHLFRHTFCYHFIRNGGDVTFLKKLAGHRNINSTFRYVNIQEADLKKSHKEHSIFKQVKINKVKK